MKSPAVTHFDLQSGKHICNCKCFLVFNLTGEGYIRIKALSYKVRYQVVSIPLILKILVLLLFFLSIPVTSLG